MGSVMVKSAPVRIPSSLSVPLMLLSGRWTREEHQLFVKGLELYGKGWKKIASLIKTRTVVQIRTHAQKYFLKLSKARQNGELAGGLGQYGFRKRRPKRRCSDRPIAIAQMLQPFLKPSSSSEALEPADIEDGIYNFLSANLEDSEESYQSSPGTLIKEEQETPRELSALTLPSSPNSPSSRRKIDHKKIVAPLWYKKGQGIDVLLREAEALDWSEDVQGLLNKFMSKSTALTSSCNEGKEEEGFRSAGSEKRKALHSGLNERQTGSENIDTKIRRLSTESLSSLMQSCHGIEINGATPREVKYHQKESTEAEEAIGFDIDTEEMLQSERDNKSPTDDHLDVFFENSYFGQAIDDKSQTTSYTTTASTSKP